MKEIQEQKRLAEIKNQPWSTKEMPSVQEVQKRKREEKELEEAKKLKEKEEEPDLLDLLLDWVSGVAEVSALLDAKYLPMGELSIKFVSK